MIRYLILFSFLIGSTNFYSQSKTRVDSINKLYVQGLNIPQDSIISLFQKNLMDAEKLSYELGMADAYSQLSLVYGYQGKYEESAKNSINGIKIYEKLNQLDRVADYYAEMGYAMKYRDLTKALYYMQKGKSIAEINNYENELKDIYNNYGVLKELNNELDSALYFFQPRLRNKIKD